MLVPDVSTPGRAPGLAFLSFWGINQLWYFAKYLNQYVNLMLCVFTLYSFYLSSFSLLKSQLLQGLSYCVNESTWKWKSAGPFFFFSIFPVFVFFFSFFSVVFVIVVILNIGLGVLAIWMTGIHLLRLSSCLVGSSDRWSVLCGAGWYLRQWEFYCSCPVTWHFTPDIKFPKSFGFLSHSLLVKSP